MMLIIHTPLIPFSTTTSSHGAQSHKAIVKNNSSHINGHGLARVSLTITSFFAAYTVVASAAAITDAETLSNIPQTLSSECASLSKEDCKKGRIQRPKSRKAESCTIKCVTTCIRGGDGAPGEGPFNIGRPFVVFKQGFRSRQYCLVECSDICNLIGDGDDGP